MKKLLLLALCSVIELIPLIAQNSIRGKITDSETGEPVFGASIYIADLKTGNTTDTNGVFIIRNVPLGSFLAEIRMIGYASQAVTLPSKSDAEWNSANITGIQLVKTPTEFHAVIITGTSGATERMRNPVPGTLQTRDHMLKHASTNAISALTELPGVSSVSTGNAISKPVIRGLGYNRVVVLRNNIRQEGQQWGDEHGIEIDEFEIDRVEVIKGPGSILYGSDAMAGVINFLTPRPASDGHIGVEFISGFQSNGNLIGNSLMQEGNVHGFSWQFRVSQKLAGNYFTPSDGHVANSGFQEWNGSGFIGLNRSWGVSQLSFSTFNQLVGLPEGERDSLGQFVLPVVTGDSVSYHSYSDNELNGFQHSIETPHQSIRHHRVVLSNNFVFKNSHLQVDLGFQQNNRFEFGDVLEPQTAQVGMKLNTWNANAVYFFPERNGAQLTTGINLQNQQNHNTGTEFIVPDYTANDAGAFVYYRKIKGAWFFGTGLRTDVRLLHSEDLLLDSTGVPTEDTQTGIRKFTAVQKNFPSVSATAGVSCQLQNKLVFRFNLARGFRVPNAAELAANGNHEGTFRYEKGNPGLKSETSFQADAGMTYTTDHFNLDVSGFYNGIDNYIFLSKLNSVFGGDSIIDPGDPVPVYSFVQGNAALYGGEIYSDLHPHPLDWLHFENSFSMVIGDLFNQPDSMSHLPFMPPMKYQTELNAHGDKQHGRFINYYASASLAWYFDQNRIYSAYGTETATPGYILFDAGAGTDIARKDGKVLLRVFFAANNILNADYRSHLSRLKYAPVNPATGISGISNPGRNFSVRIIIPFSFSKS